MAKFNIKFKNKSYSIDKSKLSGAIARLEAALSNLSGDVPEDKNVRLLSLDHFILMDVNGFYITAKENN